MKEKLYEKIYKDYYYDILFNKLNAGDKITEKETVKKYSVSRITAVKAINLLKKAGMVKRCRKSGTKVLPFTASNFSNKKIIAVITSFLSDNNNLYNGLKNAAEEKGLFLVFFDTKKSATEERKILKRLMNFDICGLIIEPCTRQGNIDVLSEYIIKKTPIVFVDTEIEGLNIPCISSDNRAGMFMLVNNLVKKGYKNIAYYPMHLYLKTSESQRFKGYCEALINNNIKVEQNNLLWVDLSKKNIDLQNRNVSQFDIENAKIVLKGCMLQKEKPQVICCVNDNSAICIIEAAKILGIKIPENLVITGFDNNKTAKQYNIISVAQNYENMGKYAVYKLTDLLKNFNDNKDIKISVDIIER